MYTKISNHIESFNFSQITEARKQTLQPLIDYIQAKHTAQSEIRLNFICTHNSRRSHLSQIWAQAAAHFFNIKNVYCYSGGTEATAMFPMVAETLINNGFSIQKLSLTDNPVYAVKFDINQAPVIGFSKRFDDAFNPETEFAAIMTCSQADQGCPFIAGAEKRIPITFEDPKAFDNTPQQAEKYTERSLQIAQEMSYVFSKIN
ncbi:protein-tyrosine-phosphatase [Formosa sediminum]|uniref:Protein-tyrosine-phosphatase n=1 Tax=Formosa sediminum TaxID=2594004 RepID=A0A516GTY3_9FLAO|nr:protein-tyrosine-phosphatase [Formosa sediminum]QDO94977.1 protein-tyrosine-phosphatase [Formosa sediminum]